MTEPRTAAGRERPADRKTFFNFVADRLVQVYGESPNLDYIHRLRAEAEAASPDSEALRAALERLIQTWDTYGTTEVTSWGVEAVHEPWLLALKQARAALTAREEQL
jgi:hypothetical protein